MNIKEVHVRSEMYISHKKSVEHGVTMIRE
jgi:uncharacterized protein YegP (UPF0339 family)